MFALIIPLQGHDLPGFGGGWGGAPHPGGGPIYHPGHPDHGLPSHGHPDQGLPGGRPDHPWWGGRDPNRPDQGLPVTPTPKGNMYAAVPDTAIPDQPDAPNPAHGEWVLVALGDRKMGWAWLDTAPVATPKK